MENKDFPQQEDNEILPLELDFTPDSQELNETTIQELSFEKEIPQDPQTFDRQEMPQEIEIPLEQKLPTESESPFEQEPGVPEEQAAAEVAETPLEEPARPADVFGEDPAQLSEASDGLVYPPELEEVFQQAPEAEPELPDEIDSLLTDPLLSTGTESPLPEETSQPQPEEINDQEYQDSKEPAEIVDTPVQKPGPHRKRPARKGRPKKRGGEGLWGIPNILATAVWLVLIVAIGVTAGRMAWVCAADVLAFGKEDKPVTITVYERDTMEDITEKLYKNGLIRYRSLFNFYADFAHAEEKIKPGIYDLNTRYDYHALVNFMTPSSNRTIVKVMIPEGFTCAQIFSLLEENKVCTAVDLAAYAANGELDDYWFLENVDRGTENSLEGFLFPDTYEFYKNDTPRNILQRMLNNFDNRFDEEMRGQIDSLNNHISEMMRNDGRSDDYIASHLFTVREVAIVASLIEKETAHSGESPVIASVIYNRLFNWGGTPAYLNIDAAIVYALNGKTNLTKEDLQVDSPYNTYLHTGLPPAPISNPGLTSLKAALNPESTDYYFYVLNPAEGSHQFSTTREEHEANVARFSSNSEG